MATAKKSDDPGANVASELQAAHEARVTVPGAPSVDARLDNRTGDQRPPVEEFPAKPQQVDGPDVVHQLEHTRKVLADRDNAKDAGERKGMFSPGPHGLSPESVREGDPAKKDDAPLYGTESFTEAELEAQEPPKADDAKDGDKK